MAKTSNLPDLTWFTECLGRWLVAECGSKPTPDMLRAPLLLGKRPGNEALHIAMCLRPAGCTVRQFQIAGSCGPANNYRRRLVREGLFAETVEGKPYAYKLVITDKGTKAVEKAKAALAGQPVNTAAVKAAGAAATASIKASKAAHATTVADTATADATKAARKAARAAKRLAQGEASLIKVISEVQPEPVTAPVTEPVTV